MRNRTRPLFGALAAVVVLGAAVGIASANRFGLSDNTFKAVWNPLTFSEPLGGGAVRCRVTLEGTLHSKTIEKIEGSLIGYVTRVSVAESSCTGGTARPLAATLPWHIKYETFEGALPNIRRINILLEGTAFLVHVNLGPECLFGGTARGIIIRVGNVAESLEADPNTLIPLVRRLNATGANCPTMGRFSGRTASLTRQATTEDITVELIA
jgi:hypothetical protein